MKSVSWSLNFCLSACLCLYERVDYPSILNLIPSNECISMWFFLFAGPFWITISTSKGPGITWKWLKMLPSWLELASTKHFSLGLAVVINILWFSLNGYRSIGAYSWSDVIMEKVGIWILKTQYNCSAIVEREIC